jgi:hypothetical protein
MKQYKKMPSSKKMVLWIGQIEKYFSFGKEIKGNGIQLLRCEMADVRKFILENHTLKCYFLQHLPCEFLLQLLKSLAKATF